MSGTNADSTAQPGSVVEPVPGTPEYDAAMAKVGEGVVFQQFTTSGQPIEQPTEVTKTTEADPSVTIPVTEQKPQGERPAWLPEGFNTPEELAAAYADLKKPQGEQPAAEQKPANEAPPVVPGVDTEALSKEWAEKGELSQASYDKLAKAGITKDVVDDYIAGKLAQQEQRTQEGFSLVGGKENYAEMISWAKANLTPAESQAFNAQVGGSKEAAMLAVRGLHSKFVAATGSAPKGLLTGAAPAGEGNRSGFASRTQVVAAMSDPRYESDPAYRATVMARLSVTPDSII